VSKRVRMVDVETIRVPRERVTSIFDPEILDELYHSIKVKGILTPLLCMDVNGEIWLIDGLHRIQAAKKIGMSKVPCIVKKGTEEDLLIENLIANRVRGKSNPVHEAMLVKKLREDFGYSFKSIARRLGMSTYTCKKLYDLTDLPDQVLRLIEAGQLGVGKAWMLRQIPDDRDRIRAADDIVKFKYTEGQVHELVKYYLTVISETPVQHTKPTLVTPEREMDTSCELCNYLLKLKSTYHWICDDCWELITQAYKMVKAKHEREDAETKGD